jgi:hypothetical protein
MTQRYSDRGSNMLFQDPEGPFVHYLDYEELRRFVERVASIHDGPPHKVWFRELGREARKLLEK